MNGHQLLAELMKLPPEQLAKEVYVLTCNCGCGRSGAIGFVHADEDATSIEIGKQSSFAELDVDLQSPPRTT
jgi:hypothetical protein